MTTKQLTLEEQLNSIGGNADGVHRLLGREQAKLAQKAINKRDYALAEQYLETALGHVRELRGAEPEQKTVGDALDELDQAGPETGAQA